MSRRANGQVAYGELTETEDESGDDAVGLVLKDEDSSSRSRKYVVSGGRKYEGRIPTWCHPKLWTRNERVCVVIGVIALVVILCLFVAVGVIASQSRGKLPEGGKDSSVNDQSMNGTDHGGGKNGTNHGGMNHNNGTDHSNGTDHGGDREVPWSSIRLQPSVVPDMYSIHLMVDMENLWVSGGVSIACSVKTSVTYIALHAKDMNITGHAMSDIDRNNVEHIIVLYPENDFLIFNLTAPIGPGQVVVALQFSYALRDDLAGFYKSSYMNSNGEKRYLATTQFEATDARRAFPCFDEPSFKAKFSMQITHNSQYRAWFNMPVTSISPAPDSAGQDMVTTSFQTSVRMSTYLVAFIVSDFECKNDTIRSISTHDILIQVCSNPEVVENTNYALEAAKDVIMFYEQEFGVAYPLPKQDLFAIPDFAVGAMENWGLITYRETALIYDEDTNPATSKQWVAVVVAHELAHQWFGDLVTMAWWDGLWLNEGFASFMEYLGADHFEPSFSMMEQFVRSDLTVAMNSDGLNESHPIIQEVHNPDEISSLFDSISYSKGASVIRMLRSYLGVDAFRSGITFYLNQHRYGNAETHELWEALQSGNPRNESSVTEMMDTWTKQMGYPVFNVNQTTNSLTQTRFFYFKPEDPSTIAASPYQYIWKAPFNYMHYSASGNFNTVDLPLVTTETTSIQWPSGGWIKANINQTGFYRVNYDISNWLEIAEYLKTTDLETSVLTPKDRAGLLDDAFALSYSGQLDTVVAVNLSIYLVGERHYVPWATALSWFYRLDGILSLTPFYGQYRKILSMILGPVVRSVPITSTNLTHLDIYLRSMVLGAAVHYGDTEVRKNITELFQQWRLNNISVNPDLKSLVYGVGVAEGGEDAWNFVWHKYLQSNDPYEKDLYLRALAQTDRPWLLSRYLNYSIAKIRSQDTLTVIIFVSRNIHGRYLAWNFVRSNWPYLRARYGGGISFERFIRYIVADFATEFELQEMKAFFAKYPDTGTATRGFRQAIEVIKANIAWLNIYRGRLFSDKDSFHPSL